MPDLTTVGTATEGHAPPEPDAPPKKRDKKQRSSSNAESQKKRISTDGTPTTKKEKDPNKSLARVRAIIATDEKTSEQASLTSLPSSPLITSPSSLSTTTTSTTSFSAEQLPSSPTSLRSPTPTVVIVPDEEVPQSTSTDVEPSPPLETISETTTTVTPLVKSPEEMALEIFNGGMKKSEIGPYLGRKKDYNSKVLVEYVKLFDFHNKKLDESFRLFLDKFSLTGEAQEVDRVIEQFALRYHEQNKDQFKNWTVVHTLVSSMLILNTDLHSGRVDHKMRREDFIENTFRALTTDERPPESLLKELYNSVKSREIVLTQDDEVKAMRASQVPPSSFFRFSLRQSASMQSLPADLGRNNSVRSVSSASSSEDNSPSYCEGVLIKKNVLDGPDKKAASRSWRAVDAVLRDTGIHLYKTDSSNKIPRERRHQEDINVRHALASPVQGYPDRLFVFSLLLASGALIYFECRDEASMFRWVACVNYVAAMTSAPPLAAAVGSQAVFRRPVLPSSMTPLDAEHQLENHKKKIIEFDEKIFRHVEHRDDVLAKGSGRGSKTLEALAAWDQEMTYLNGERQKYETYIQSMEQGPPKMMSPPDSAVSSSNGSKPEPIAEHPVDDGSGVDF